jgi:O-antigen/teichoic acid export membrane protein
LKNHSEKKGHLVSKIPVYLTGLFSQLNLGSASEPLLSEEESQVLSALHKTDGLDREALGSTLGLTEEKLDETLDHLKQLHGLREKDGMWFLPERKPDDSPDKKLLGNGLKFLRWQVLGVAIRLGLQLLIARWLHVEHYGVYSLIYTTAFVLATLAALGFPVQLSRLVPLYLQQNEMGLLHGYLRFALGTAFKLGMLFFLLSIPIVWFAEGAKGQVEEWITGLALIPLLSVGFVLEGVLAARKQWLASLAQAIIVPIIFLGFAFVITRYFEKEEMEYIFAAMGVALMIGMKIEYHYYRKSLPPELWEAPMQFQRKEWLKTSAQILVIATFVIILLRADLLVVGYFKGKHSAGLYNAVISLLMVLPLWQAAINAVTNPDIAPLYKNGDMATLQRLVSRGIWLAFWPTLVLGAIYIVFGKYFLSFFGEGFEAAHPVLVILTTLYIAQAGTGNPGYLLMMAGKPTALTKTLAVVIIVDVILLMALTPLAGIQGAALSTLLASLISRILLYRKCRETVEIRVSMFERNKGA